MSPDGPNRSQGSAAVDHAPSPQSMAERTASFFTSSSSGAEQAKTDDSSLEERLASAATVVHIHYGESAGATLWLDRVPVEAEPRIVGDAEVDLWGDPETFMRMFRGESHLAMEIARGAIVYRGPVRKFLRIMPILRRLSFSMWRGLRADGSVSRPAG